MDAIGTSSQSTLWCTGRCALERRASKTSDKALPRLGAATGSAKGALPSGGRGSGRRDEAGLEVAGQVAQQGEVEIGARLDPGALGVDAAGPGLGAFDHRVDQTRIELRLGKG